MSLPKPSGLPRLSEVKLTRRTLVAGGAALVVTGAGVAVGVTRCSRGAADVPVEPTAGAEASENGAAKLGGKLSLYTSCPEELVNAVVARFSQDAGVTVAVVRGSEAELVGQLLDGDVAGKPAADVIWGGEALWYADVDGASSGLESVQREVGAFALAEGLADGKKGTPAAYADLLATALAGRVALCDPTSCEAGWLHLVAMLSEASGTSAGGTLGDDVSWAFVQELLAEGAVVCSDEDVAVQTLLGGSVDVALVSEQRARQLARRTGQTTVAWPESAVGVADACAGAVGGCLNERQAEAFVEFLAGHDGQQVVADALARPVADDVQVAGGDDVPADDDLEVAQTDAAVAAKQREEILATWARVLAGEWAPAAAEEDAAEDEGEAREAKA